MPPFFSISPGLLAGLAIAMVVAACSSDKPPAPAPAPAAPAAPVVVVPAAPPAAPAPAPGAAAPRPPAAPPVVSGPPPASTARTPLAYRRDGASHLYALNADRIYQGKLQPNLMAVGVIEVDIDRQGHITNINWRRAPSHVPEVMAEIIRTIRAAAPFPVPIRMGKVTYTEIWLWDKSGKFQLDTLTEGQL